jgi:hypothetical protein
MSASHLWCKISQLSRDIVDIRYISQTSRLADCTMGDLTGAGNHKEMFR